jgi:hypothetical protein
MMFRTFKNSLLSGTISVLLCLPAVAGPLGIVSRTIQEPPVVQLAVLPREGRVLMQRRFAVVRSLWSWLCRQRRARDVPDLPSALNFARRPPLRDAYPRGPPSPGEQLRIATGRPVAAPFCACASFGDACQSGSR